jgi:hypothetical protein
MKRAATFVVLSTLACTFVAAAEMGWRDRSGKAVPDTSDQRVVKGFGGWLVVTSDADWEAKWDTPSDNTPAFTTVDEVALGQTITILVFYANPRFDAKRAIKVSCDITVTRPDGSKSIDKNGIECASGHVMGPAANLRLSNFVLKVLAEPSDPPGRWGVDVTVRDDIAKISVPLRTHFVLKGASG